MFLSTPPSRVATGSIKCYRKAKGCFYPRHPRGWRPKLNVPGRLRLDVSIHATLAGGDGECRCCHQTQTLFLSTPPSRVATRRFWWSCSPQNCFYPRHPRGWRQRRVKSVFYGGMFLSTPPSRVATAKVYKNVQCLLRKREKIICKIKNNLKHPPHIPIATSKKCTACPKRSDGIGAKLLGKVCLLPPRTGAATQTAHHPEQIRGGGQGAPRGFCSGCQAGKSAGCRFRG